MYNNFTKKINFNKKVTRWVTKICVINYFFQINFNNIIAPEGIINATNNGIRISSKKSGEIYNILETTKRSKTAKLEINTVNRTFIQFFLERFNNNITTAASTKSSITNNQSSFNFRPSNNRINTARRTTLTINQNIRFFNQDFILSIFYKLENK